jgi:YegS/Rv2252/BmrU family lipid kinase
VNPKAGSGKAKALWGKIKNALEAAGLIFDYTLSEYAGHETVLSRAAVLSGYTQIISVGGDGTIQKVVTGIYSQEKLSPKLIVIGVIACGTGNDWIKTHNLPLDYKNAIQVIVNKKIKAQDLGKIHVSGKKKKTLYFINYAGAGFDCFVLSKLYLYKRFGAFSYFLCAIINFMQFKNLKITVVLDSTTVEANIFLLGIGLCSFTGGGMRLTKNADPFDGLFDVTIAQDFTKFDILRNLPRLFNGELFKDRKVFTYRSKKIQVMSGNGNVLSQADGEILDKGCLNYSIVPEGFRYCSS